jgi:hypothetical protein
LTCVTWTPPAHNRYYVAAQPDIDKHADVHRETIKLSSIWQACFDMIGRHDYFDLVEHRPQPRHCAREVLIRRN